MLLSREQHDVVLTEQNEALVERATGRLDALTIQGNGVSPRLLAEAGVKQSDLLIAHDEFGRGDQSLIRSLRRRPSLPC